MNLLYNVKINDLVNTEKFNELLDLVSKEKQEEINHFRFHIDKKLSLYSNVLVRILIRKFLNINNSHIVFQKNGYGKPLLMNYADFHFNISHTRNAFVVAISDGVVGVDIENVRTADLKIAKRFFTDNEYIYITELEVGTDERFFEIWTKKEAYVKATPHNSG